jgi:ANTAR domain/GAF domain
MDAELTPRSEERSGLVTTPADPATVFASLAEIVYSGTDSSEIYTALCVAATLMVPGCDHAAAMMRRRGEYVTVAATDPIAARVDELERLTGEGPCVDAIEDRPVQVEPDLASATQWPTFAQSVIEETPVRGVMGFRLIVDGRKVGALDLFSDTAGRFDAASVEQGIVLASFATVAAIATARGEDVESLLRGLKSNREISKAIGMMMVLHDITDSQAFDTLRRASQNLNIKIADIAAAVIKQRGRLR